MAIYIGLPQLNFNNKQIYLMMQNIGPILDKY